MTKVTDLTCVLRGMPDGKRSYASSTLVRAAQRPRQPIPDGSPEAAEAFAKLDAESLKKRYQKAELVEGETGHWTTEEGDVFIQQQGELVLVTEGFEGGISNQLRSAACSAIAEKSTH